MVCVGALPVADQAGPELRYLHGGKEKPFTANQARILGPAGSGGSVGPLQGRSAFPGGSREWNWRETGTSHQPGIQIADVKELLKRGAKVVILSRGMAQCLQVPRETLEFLQDRQVSAHVLPTPEAVETYNKLAEKEAVGGLFHTTC